MSRLHDVNPRQVEEVIHQILSLITDDEKHDNAFSWETLDNIVNSWNREIGFSWHKQSEMKHPSKFRIFPVFVDKIRLGSRQNLSTCPNPALPCPMRDCKTEIGGKNGSIQRKNLKRHFLSHFYTITNPPCQDCELMDQKACFQVDIQKCFFLMLLIFILKTL